MFEFFQNHTNFLNFLQNAKPYNYPLQFSFVEPANNLMLGVIDLHHTLFFYLIIVFCTVAYTLGYLIFAKPLVSSTSNSTISFFNHDTTLEIVWTLIPSFIISMVLLPSLALLHTSDELIDPTITVKVIGHQWYWSYELSDFENYSNSNTLNNTYHIDCYIKNNWMKLLADPILVLPGNTSIRFLITSEDVIHSWAVPNWAVKMDAIPGRLNQIITTITRPGMFYGQCSEICGIGHGFMPITILITTPLEFNSYMNTTFILN